jgi:hypothetical protein
VGRLTVGDVATGRAGDKGATLDLTVVAADDTAYRTLAAQLTAEAIADRLGAQHADRYELPALAALKFVLPGFLGAGPWASRKAGVHWQKTSISAVLSMPLNEQYE